MQKIILDTDPGVDDAMAIAYALLHPDIDLIALTTVFGNASNELTTRNAQFILETFGATDVAVARGASAPLEQALLPPADFVHGADGIGNVYPGSTVDAPANVAATLNPDARHSSLEPLDAADFIIDAARRQPGEIMLVAVGPLTNIAEAFRREPKLPELVCGLVIMGGALDEPGNVTPIAEANFYNDPHAADELMAANWPLTLVGLDVTHQIMLTDSHLKQLDREAGVTGAFIWNSSRFYVDFYTHSGAARDDAQAGGEPQCAMHDAAAIACVLIPDAYGTVDGVARVIPEGMAAGQLTLDRKGYQYVLPSWSGRPDTRVCITVEAERVRDHFLNTLIAHYRR